MENSSKLSEQHSNESKSSLIGKSGGTCSGGNILNQKQELLKQFDPHLKEQLLPHIWNVISYNPLKFYIAHNEHKQIIISSVKKEKLNVNEGNFNLSLTNEIHSLCPTKIIIEAIPVEVTRHEDPLGLSSEHKYTIKFETQIEKQKTITIGPKSLDEILQELHNRTLIVDQQPKAGEALSSIILSMEKDNQVIINKEVTTPGFYLINNQIKGYNIDNYHPNPSKDEIANCLELLELLQQKFKNDKVFPTIVKWSCIAPFVYVMKQKNNNKIWIPWVYLYGSSRTGKTTLGDISCAIQGNYLDEKYKIPFTNVDTVAKLGEALSKSTFPLVINESGALSDDSKYYKNLIEMIKTAIEGPIARSKFVHRTIYTAIPSFCACIFTSNSAPPYDIGFRRRIIVISFTQKDEYTLEEIIEFEKLLNRVSELKVLGDFAANYILEHQELILLDDKNRKDWDEIAKLVLYEMYKIAERKPPEWIEYKIDKEIQFQENKEEMDLVLRNFLITKINEAYCKYYKSIADSKYVDGINQPFDYRLIFCIQHNLIPFLNTNSNSEIIITSDLIQELKNRRIYVISSLKEVSNIIDGFEYDQKKLGGKRNVRAAFGSRLQFSKFLIFDEE